MINNQNKSSAFGTPLRKRLVVGATSVLATGALLGVGIAGASAATVQPSPHVAHATSSAAHGSARITSLIERLRADLFQGRISGTKAKVLAKRIVDDTTVFSALPAKLQSALTALKNAPASDAAAQAETIKSTALAGGYGSEIKAFATDLAASANLPIGHKLIDEIRHDLLTGTSAGATGALIAKTVSEHPALFSKLPANLQSDVTALKNSPEHTMRLLAIEHAAVAGSYGPQIKDLAQQLVSMTGASK